MTQKRINIAIDGHSSCGKSTLAKQLAAALGYLYIDSGAMYRAVCLYFLQNDINLSDKKQVSMALDQVNISMENNEGTFLIQLNGKDVTNRIIRLDVSSKVSEVAALSIVRRKLVEIQKQQGIHKGVVMDGRDIGTVVYPSAELKLFVTAEIEVRTQRRFIELKEKNMETPYDAVRQNLMHRDHIDSTREDSPLKQAEDAILLDNSFMNRKEQLFLCLKLAKERILG